MREDTGIIKAGMSIIVSSGCYSDYSFSQVFIALKDFNYMEEAKKFFFEHMNENKEEVLEDGYYSICRSDFEGWLFRNGFIDLCESREIHIGSYGSFFEDEGWYEEWKKEQGL